MKTVSVQKANAATGRKLFAMATQSPLLVTTNGRPAWAIVPVAEGEDIEDFLTANSPVFRRIIEHSWRNLRKKGGVSHDEVKRRFGIK